MTSPRALLLAVALAAGPSVAQTGTSRSIPLADAQADLLRLAPDARTGVAEFSVLRATAVAIDVVASSDLADVVVVGPDGTPLDSTAVRDLGGDYSTYELTPDDIAGLPAFGYTPGRHYLFRLPSRGDGVYRVEVAGGDVETAVAVRTLTDSELVAGLSVSEAVVPVGRGVLLTLALFDGPAPVAVGPVSLTVRGPSGAIDVALADDGTGGDATAGDGLYTGGAPTVAVGTYAASARVEGALPDGTPFTRLVASTFRAVSASGTIEGVGGDAGVDADGDGDLDAIEVPVEVALAEDLAHVVVIRARGATGAAFLGRAEAPALSGPRTVPVRFRAADLRAAGEAGPLTLDRVDLVALADDGSWTVDRLYAAGTTAAYDLDAFDRPPVLFTGEASDAATDLDGDGDFDRLTVSLGVDVERAGYYQWSGRLVGPDRSPVAIGGAAGSLAAGANSITVPFGGAEIGERGVDGPYTVTDFLIYSSTTGVNAVASDLATTAAYAACDFGGCDATPPVLALAEPASMWPPDHSLVTFGVADMVVSVDDPEAGPLPVDSVRVVRVTVDEPRDDRTESAGGTEGDGNTRYDVFIAGDGRSVQLRRERQGKGDGRVYTVTLAATDPAGNEGTAAYVVTVPKSASRAAVDSGAQYTVEGAGAAGRRAQGAPDDAPSAAGPSVRHFPNPAREAVTFEVVSEGGPTMVTLFDVTGRSVRALDLGDRTAGVHRAALDLSGVAPGIYIYVVETAGTRRSERLVVAR